MPTTPGIDTTRLSALESELDAAFENELQLSAIPKGVAREALLDVTELLLTGQGKEIDEESGAMSSYFNNLTKSASSVLRQIERFAIDETRQFDPEWDASIRRCISTCSFFAVVEDAFFTCWKGYSSARISGSEVVFEPLGSQLDARLRFFRTHDGYDKDSDGIFNIDILTSPEIMNGVAESLMATDFKRAGGFEYVMVLPVVQRIAEEFERVLAPQIKGALEIELGGFTSRDLLRAWCRLLSLARLHWLARLLTSKVPARPQTSFIVPALYRQRPFWLSALAGLPEPERLLQVLTFDPADKGGDVCVTPLVKIQDDYFGLIPSSTLRSNVPRNLLVLIASRFSTAYSGFSLAREDEAIREYKSNHADALIDTQIKLPKWNGKQLPDIDLLFANPERTHLVLAELKWQLSASSTREVATRNDYLKKGSAQLLAIRDFLAANPEYLKNRGLIDKSTDDLKLSFLLLCKGHLGSETVMTAPEILMCDNETFLGALGEGLGAAIDLVRSFDYLPKEGKDFILRDVKVRFGSKTVAWKAMIPPSTTEDTESDLIEAFYMDGARFAVI